MCVCMYECMNVCIMSCIDIDFIDKLIVCCFGTGKAGRRGKGLIPDGLVQHGVGKHNICHHHDSPF